MSCTGLILPMVISVLVQIVHVRCQCNGSPLVVHLPRYNTTSIYSPGFPDIYETNLNCSWILECEHETDYFFIRMDNVYIDCNGDGIRLTNLRRNHRHAPFCSDAATSDIYIESGRVRIDFTSDAQQRPNDKGFQLRITRIPDLHKEVTVCSSDVQLEAGTDAKALLSPSFPHSYAANLNCHWTIPCKPGYLIQIDIEMLDIEYATTPPQDPLDYLQMSSELLGPEMKAPSTIAEETTETSTDGMTTEDATMATTELTQTTEKSMTIVSTEPIMPTTEPAQTTDSSLTTEEVLATTELVVSTTVQGQTSNDVKTSEDILYSTEPAITTEQTSLYTSHDMSTSAALTSTSGEVMVTAVDKMSTTDTMSTADNTDLKGNAYTANSTTEIELSQTSDFMEMQTTVTTSTKEFVEKSTVMSHTSTEGAASITAKVTNSSKDSKDPSEPAIPKFVYARAGSSCDLHSCVVPLVAAIGLLLSVLFVIIVITSARRFRRRNMYRMTDPKASHPLVPITRNTNGDSNL
ncbi:uncharacterized protein [Argopecten irradians]|uniref:uncharacterized protein isoform X2 n=1 Tax=Argopecten irradians TaxID=31199 RepID=UPI00371CDD0C